MKLIRNASILFLINVVVLLFLFSCSNKIVNVYDSNTEYTDYLIRTQKIKFHIEDTIVNATVYIQPDGTFFFKDSFDIKPEFTRISFKEEGKNIIHYKDKFVPKTDSILNLMSYFPILITHDSSVINHYDNPHEFDFNLVYETQYSFLLDNLKEPIIKDSSYIQEIRIILPYIMGFHSVHPVIYSSIRLSMKHEKRLLYYSEGKYDSLANFMVVKKDSCYIKEKHVAKIEDIIQNIDFEQEYHFTEIGSDIYDRFLIEIKMNNKYYVFERALYNEYNQNKNINRLYFNLIGLKMKYLE